MAVDKNLIKSELIIDESCDAVINDLRRLNIRLPGESSYSGGEIDFDVGSEYELVPLEDDASYVLDAKKGMEVMKKDSHSIWAYDESIKTYSALEGKAMMTSHALVYMRPEKYIPISYLTLKFYTQSEKVLEAAGKSAIKTEHPDRQASIDRALEKMYLINERCIDNSILFIDGPLIGGDAYTTIMKDVLALSDRGIVPVFFVKNSSSNMISTYIPELSRGYNNDMHWANDTLKVGSRTQFFKYTDRHNSNNSKVFCYVKFMTGRSPVRIEMPTTVYEKYLSTVDSIMDGIYYLLLTQGNYSNPQIRPIAVAEMYAREIIKIYDIHKEIRKAGLTYTMNEERMNIDEMDSSR